MTMSHGSLSLKIVAADGVAPQPWRNGGGQTRELFAWPTGADWRLRLSLADITQDGPFSAFAGVERWFAVLSGAGVRLGFAGQWASLTPQSEPIRFEGAAAPDCRLIDGPTRDLNLMLRELPGAMRIALPGVPGPRGARWRGLFCADAVLLHGAEAEARALAPLTLAHALVHPDAPGWHFSALSPRARARAWWLEADIDEFTDPLHCP
jgi:environmental stress-induced protein Ves